MGVGIFKFPRKARRCRHFSDDGLLIRRDNPCPYKSADCHFKHPDDPEWDELPRRTSYRQMAPPLSPNLERRRSSGRRRSRTRTRSRSMERERERRYTDRERPVSRNSHGDSVASSREGDLAQKNPTVTIPTEPAAHRCPTLSPSSPKITRTHTRPTTPPPDTSNQPSPPPPPVTPPPLPLPSPMHVELSQPQQPQHLPSPPPPPPPLPDMPNLDLSSPTIPEVSFEAKSDSWTKRVKTMADLLSYHNKVLQLTSDVDELSRYSTSPFFTSISSSEGDDDERRRLETEITGLQSSRDAAQQQMQKLFEELITSDSWPSPPVIDDVQKQNTTLVDYIRSLQGVMNDVRESLTEVGAMVRPDVKSKQRGTKRRKREKDKEEEITVATDAMDIDAPEPPTPHDDTIDGDDTDEDSDTSTYRYTSTLNKLNRRVTKLSSRVTSLVHSLEQTESSWMLELSDAYADLQQTHAYTLSSQLNANKSAIESHATSLRASLNQISDNTTTLTTKVDDNIKQTTEMLERLTRLKEERNELVERQKKFWDIELPGMKRVFEEMEKERETDKKRIGVLEKAVEAFNRRPPESMVYPPSLPHHHTLPTPISPTNTTSLRTASPTATTQPHPQPDYQFLIHTLKPYLTHSLREFSKPLIQDVRTKVEERVNAEKSEMRGHMWDKLGLTLKVLDRVKDGAEGAVSIHDDDIGTGTSGKGVPENGKEKREKLAESEVEEGEVVSNGATANPVKHAGANGIAMAQSMVVD